jgi:hypothetical protein
VEDFARGGLGDKVEMEGAFWKVLAKEVFNDNKNQRCIQEDFNKRG